MEPFVIKEYYTPSTAMTMNKTDKIPFKTKVLEIEDIFGFNQYQKNNKILVKKTLDA